MNFALTSTIIISLISLLSAASLLLLKKQLHKIIAFLLALAAGTLMADAFFHLLPESIEVLGAELSLQVTFMAFLGFFLIEKLLGWHHCHKDHCEVHSVAYMNLLGDSVHNFIDGLIIAASFAVSWEVGLGASLAIILHELPQELGDFGVLLHAGLSKKQVVFFNFFVSLFAILGVLIGQWLFDFSEVAIHYLLAIAAGGFLYIAAADLLPEIRAEKSFSKLAKSLFFVFLGVAIIYSLKFLE